MIGLERLKRTLVSNPKRVFMPKTDYFHSANLASSLIAFSIDPNRTKGEGKWERISLDEGYDILKSKKK